MNVLTIITTISAMVTAVTATKTITVNPTLFATEGGTKVIVELNNINTPTNNNIWCRITPPKGGTTFGVKGYRIRGIVDFPGIVMNNNTITCNPPQAISNGPAYFSVSIDNKTSWIGNEQVTYINLFEVAVDKRPYVTETSGKLLVHKHASINSNDVKNITLYLPSLQLKWEWEKKDIAFSDFGRNELALEFTFEKFSNNNVHSDVEIFITMATSDGKTTIFNYLKRFHKVSPPSKNSKVEIVQVNHATKHLIVNGNTYIGNGFYVSHAPMSIENATFFFRTMNSLNINQFMFYGMPSLENNYILQLFDTAYKHDCKILYQSVGDHSIIKNGGPFNNTDLPWYRHFINNITLVKDHPALLGYYICDDCCMNQKSISMMSQAYNIIKNMDPYHAVIGAINCGNTWMFADGTSYLQPEIPVNSIDQPNGKQPQLQLSLDYMMQENYNTDLKNHINIGGTWEDDSNKNFFDGHFRHGVPFEVVVNSPPSNSFNLDLPAHFDNTLSWLSLVTGKLHDQLNFIYLMDHNKTICSNHGKCIDYFEFYTQLAKYASYFKSLNKTFISEFGSEQSTIEVEMNVMNGDSNSNDIIGRGYIQRRGAEADLALQSNKPHVTIINDFCMHIVLINSNWTDIKFQANFIDFPSSLWPEPPSSSSGLKATRMFDQTYSVPLLKSNNMFSDDICGGCVNFYRIGDGC